MTIKDLIFYLDKFRVEQGDDIEVVCANHLIGALHLEDNKIVLMDHKESADRQLKQWQSQD